MTDNTQLPTPQGDSANYADYRRISYPSYAEQFDILFHEGFDAWKSVIQSVKDQFPKE
jgi:hypothetical protein